MILVSACLLGIDCRYDGNNNTNFELLEFLKDKEFVPFCPEQLGGLETPREPAEIINSGDKLKVVTKSGKDVTDNFIKGANESLKLKEILKADFAILKARSPSCGSINIYDGTFTGNLIEGKGFTSEILCNSDVKVYNEYNFKDMNWRNSNEK